MGLDLDDDEDPRELRALKEGDIPKWDGNTSRRDYYKCIDMWVSATGLPPRYRAFRLLQNPRGNAWAKMEHVEPMSLRKHNGIQIFKDLLKKKAYEPIEEFRINEHKINTDVHFPGAAFLIVSCKNDPTTTKKE